jgi:hypothetical protein
VVSSATTLTRNGYLCYNKALLNISAYLFPLAAILFHPSLTTPKEAAMLPIGKGQGELWKGDTFLCKVDYDISPELTYITAAETQHIKLEVHDYDCELLLNVAGLTLVLANGSRHRLPKLINVVTGDGHLECFLGADM